MSPQLSWSSFSDFPTTTPPAYTFHQKLPSVFKDFSQLSWLSLVWNKYPQKLPSATPDASKHLSNGKVLETATSFAWKASHLQPYLWLQKVK